MTFSNAEAQEHPIERKIFPAASNMHQREGDGQVGGNNEGTRNDVQPDQTRNPAVAVSVRHEVAGCE